MIVKGLPAYPSVDLPSTDEFVPLSDPQPIVVDRRCPLSLGSITIVSGETAVSCWGSADTVAEAETGVKLQLAPDRPVVIGRQDDGIPPYLDPARDASSAVC